MKRTDCGRRGTGAVQIPVTRSATPAVVLFVALLALACTPAFQVKRFHTNTDLYEASLREFNRRKWDNAVTGFERLSTDLTARDSLLSRSHWYLAMAHERRGEHLLAATGFLRLAELFPDDSLADDALLAAGDSYFSLWHSPGLDPQYGTLAQMQYRLLGSIYPDSPLRVAADSGTLKVDEWMATKEYDTGLYYITRRGFDSAIISFKYVVKEYPNTKKVRDALMRIVEVYRRPELRYFEEAKETCTSLLAAYPGDADVKKLCGSVTSVSVDSAAKAKPSH